MSDYSSHLGSGEMSDLNTSGATSDWDPSGWNENTKSHQARWGGGYK